MTDYELYLPNTREYYTLSLERTTIYPTEYDVLSSKGKAVFDACKKRALTETPKAVLTDSIVRPARSGMWMCDKTSPFHEADDISFICGWQNRQLIGKLPDGKMMETSFIKCYECPTDSNPGWATTLTGSLYHFYTRPQ
jgi:hypothetical protein